MVEHVQLPEGYISDSRPSGPSTQAICKKEIFGHPVGERLSRHRYFVYRTPVRSQRAERECHTFREGKKLPRRLPTYTRSLFPNHSSKWASEQKAQNNSKSHSREFTLERIFRPSFRSQKRRAFPLMLVLTSQIPEGGNKVADIKASDHTGGVDQR
jgi:hypothetical protein